MGIIMGICGVGQFAESFIPLFKNHPSVDEVVLADLNIEKLHSKAERFEIERTYQSLDDLCASDVDAVAIFSQNWLHGPQSVQSLYAGKDVYSAVPMAISMQEVSDLVRTVQETGHIYMVGETSYYYPATLYCRKRFQKGDFGRVVYAEAEYYHDWDLGLYEVMKERGGEDWLKYAGSPPMYYPTHSTSQILSVTGAHMVQVYCLGWTDHHPDGIYRVDANIWSNTFSDETALFKMSDGSASRINEFRRIGYPGGERVSLYGTEGCFEQQFGNFVWVTKDHKVFEDVTSEMVGKILRPDGTETLMPEEGFRAVTRLHPIVRLPREFFGLPNGHWGSHQFLVDDFVTACITRTIPPNNVWMAARCMVPGLLAHESAVRGGEILAVPDFGEPPETGFSFQL